MFLKIPSSKMIFAGILRIVQYDMYPLSTRGPTLTAPHPAEVAVASPVDTQ